MAHYLALGFVALLLPAVDASSKNVTAQTEAVCDVPSVFWTFNSVGRSPCQVATDLAAVCNNGIYIIPSLPVKTHYVGPHMQNPCQCNTVFYSLLSACAACQGAEWLDWRRFSANCTEVYTSRFPGPLPVDERVPGWAYANIALNHQNFSLAFAQALDQIPETTGVLSATLTTSTTVSGSSESLASIASITATAASTSSSQSSSRAGAIAGSVVGGIVALVMIACLSLYCFLRYNTGRKSRAFARVPDNEPMAQDSFQAHKLYDPLPDSRTFPLPVPQGSITSYTGLYSPPPESIELHSPTLVVESSTYHGHRSGDGYYPGHVPQQLV